MSLNHVIRAVSETPWAITPDRLAVVCDVVARRARGVVLTDAELEARIGAAPARRQQVMAGSVAVIPLAGVIVPKAGLMTQVSGATSADSFAAAVAAAAGDDSVDAILLDIDSPGGMTDLIPEAAAVVRAARGVKPVVAVANTTAASAAYWLAAQASEVVVTPSGTVGSIGIFAAHDDISAAMEKDGVKTTLISAGKHKTEGNPYEPLSDEAREAIQGRVDEFYGMFVRDIAVGRGVSEAVVRGGFGEGRIVTAADALRMGMVDRVATLDETLTRLAAGAAADHAATVAAGEPPGVHADDSGPPGDETKITITKAASSGLSFADEAASVRCAVQGLVTHARSLCGPLGDRRLTAAKRDQLAALQSDLREADGEIAGLLAATTPDTQPGLDVLREAARYEHQRAAIKETHAQ